jgi:hypothetical protein
MTPYIPENTLAWLPGSPLRLTAAPGLPTVAEAGFPGLTHQSTIGPVAPAGTPARARVRRRFPLGFVNVGNHAPNDGARNASLVPENF